MRLLIDTQLLIWAGQGAGRLPRPAEALMNDAVNELIFSTVSVAEVAIKRARGKPDFQVDPREFRAVLLANDYAELPLSGDHASRIVDLPPVHKDPFDRMLVAQAMAEGMILLTADAVLSAYGAMVRVV